ncbi:MAG: tetratricopeptide repeat protein, partial [Candidatus Omnitrophica bacterium]|nr:tetratricopeptide repeat protein [Candidatus Omnitrophota bacterium]
MIFNKKINLRLSVALVLVILLVIANRCVYAQSAEEVLNKGTTYMKEGKVSEAIMEFTKAIQMNPSSLKGYFARGIAHGTNGNFGEALSDFNKVIEINPKFVPAYIVRGNLYDNNGNYEQAISDYNKAIEIDPKFASAYFERGLAYLNKNKYDLAVSDFNKVIEIDPNDVRAYSKRGIANVYKNNFTQASSDLKKAIEINPNDTEARDYLRIIDERRDAFSKLALKMNKGRAVGIKEKIYSSPSRVYKVPIPVDRSLGGKIADAANAVSFTDDFCSLFRIEFSSLPPQWGSHLGKSDKEQALRDFFEQIYLPATILIAVPSASVEYREYMDQILGGTLYVEA